MPQKGDSLWGLSSRGNRRTLLHGVANVVVVLSMVLTRFNGKKRRLETCKTRYAGVRLNHIPIFAVDTTNKLITTLIHASPTRRRHPTCFPNK